MVPLSLSVLIIALSLPSSNYTAATERSLYLNPSPSLYLEPEPE